MGFLGEEVDTLIKKSIFAKTNYSIFWRESYKHPVYPLKNQKYSKIQSEMPYHALIAMKETKRVSNSHKSKYYPLHAKNSSSYKKIEFTPIREVKTSRDILTPIESCFVIPKSYRAFNMNQLTYTYK